MASIQELERQVEMIKDMESIKQVKMRYGQIADNGCDADLIAELFTPDGKFIYVEKGIVDRTEGREAIRRRFVDIPKRIPFAVHYFVPVDIRIDGNKATGKWLMWAPQTLSTGKCVFSSGVEDDVYEKIDGKWLIQETTLTIFFRAPYGESWGDLQLPSAPKL